MQLLGERREQHWQALLFSTFAHRRGSSRSTSRGKGRVPATLVFIVVALKHTACTVFCGSNVSRCRTVQAGF
jgi:hypothetical protein